MKPAPIEIGQPAKGIATVTNTNGAAIYDSPNGQFLQTIAYDRYLPYFRKFLDNGNNWYKVTAMDGSVGWLLANNNATIKPSPDTAPPLTNLSQAIITIDPGHGGSASGAVSSFNGLQEKVANLAIATKLKELLISAGVQPTNIWMTRKATDADIDVSLKYRADLGTASGGHLFISIHNNANSTASHGTETYYQCGKEQLAETKTKSKDLATRVQQRLLASISTNTCGSQLYDRGVKCRLGSKKEDYYYVLRNTFIPSIIAECVFITNEVEGNCLQTSQFQQLLAEGIRDGIVDYLL